MVDLAMIKESINGVTSGRWCVCVKQAAMERGISVQRNRKRIIKIKN
jgi:hypothetical protein